LVLGDEERARGGKKSIDRVQRKHWERGEERQMERMKMKRERRG